MKTTKLTLCLIAILIGVFWMVDSSAKTSTFCNVHHSSRISLKGDLQTPSTRSSGILQLIDVFWNGKSLDIYSLSYLGNISIIVIDSSGNIIYQNDIILLDKNKYVVDLNDLLKGEYILKLVDQFGCCVYGEFSNVIDK